MFVIATTSAAGAQQAIGDDAVLGRDVALEDRATRR